MPDACPICATEAASLWHTETRNPLAGREFWCCPQCHAVFVPALFHPDAAEERAFYQTHENSPTDAGYRRFLSRTLEAVLPFLQPNARGLDFGSGPGPTLYLMFAEHGYSCENYDLYFAHDPAKLASSYDFITATEVFEHLRAPREILATLFACLNPGGVLAIMTQKPTTRDAFARWQYILDPTHVVFYRDTTFDWISQYFAAPIVHRGRDVVVFQKPR
ncbi:class I SAM-dependent methyltransferase [Aliidiomarina sanyensis]|uniref:Methyltransferase n=1 Tax=Aliidiomarina sanyensis TaxID=1249555 RepID=A0A432WG31_9GAMM|nr:class I SAM-dependent methyltransferase [Aliidiomarina sanyensis]RUO32677.1 methyltransferase [Aliidiomarina sanyensis]